MKRNRILVIVLIFSLVSLLGIASITQAAATCKGSNLIVTYSEGLFNEFRVNGTGPGLPTASQMGPGNFTWVVSGPGTWSNVVIEVLPWGGSWMTWNTETSSISCAADGSTVIELVEGPIAGNLLDGRINDGRYLDVAAPVAVYTDPFEVFAIDPQTSEGALLFTFSDEELESLTAGDKAVLVAEAADPYTGQMVRLWLLPTGELQLNAHYADGKAYTIAWEPDKPETLYHIES